MDTILIQHLARARLADLHRQAERDALARAARQTRRAQRIAQRAYRCGVNDVEQRAVRLPLTPETGTVTL
jgi:hypothetical protein